MEFGELSEKWDEIPANNDEKCSEYFENGFTYAIACAVLASN